MEKKTCNYCGMEISDTDEKCLNCGANNPNYKRSGYRVPKTIEELKLWYSDMNLPSEETTRFFIGKNIKEPRAFGIYKNDSGEFVVYKNKDTGERKIRYQGTDESFAVNELYLRLKEEINNQKSHGKNKNANKKSVIAVLVIFILIFFSPFILLISVFVNSEKNRTYLTDYYYKDDEVYFNYDNTWYACRDGWVEIEKPEDPYTLRSSYYPDDSLKCSDFRKDKEFIEKHGYPLKYIYLEEENILYYHYSGQWFYYDEEWKYYDNADPIIGDFTYSEELLDKYNATDITKTTIYYEKVGYPSGYYKQDDRYYYFLDSQWYIYDGYDWDTTTNPTFDGSTIEHSTYYDDYDCKDFEDTDYYSQYLDSFNNSYDNDSSWDGGSSWDSGSDSWDSGSTDWGSDW